MSTTRTIWKFPIDLADTITVPMPEGAKVLHVGTQQDWVHPTCLWAEVDPDAPMVDRLFTFRGTGWTLGDVGRYVGTVHNDPFVWHIYEALETEEDGD